MIDPTLAIILYALAAAYAAGHMHAVFSHAGARNLALSVPFAVAVGAFWPLLLAGVVWVTRRRNDKGEQQ